VLHVCPSEGGKASSLAAAVVVHSNLMSHSAEFVLGVRGVMEQGSQLSTSPVPVGSFHAGRALRKTVSVVRVVRDIA